MYFNYQSYVAQNWWDRRRFLSKWWQIYADDPRWVPPYFPTLQKLVLNPPADPYIRQVMRLLVYLEALPRHGQTRSPNSNALSLETMGALFEEPVAAAIVMLDPRRRDRFAYLGHLHCVNDRSSLERYLDVLAEELKPAGIQGLIGPVGLSPHVQSGVLMDYFHENPPLHTPYNPPYLPELMDQVFQPWASSRLYELSVPKVVDVPAGPGRLAPLSLSSLVTEHLELFQSTVALWPNFPPLDRTEAGFLLRWCGDWPMLGWTAEVDGQIVGFLVLQPDLSTVLRRAKGGRNLLWRLWLTWRKRRPVAAGRILWGGVSPEWRGRGIGTQLLRHGLAVARELGWRRLTVGPLPDLAPSVTFLSGHGAQARQTYCLYQYQF